VEVFYPGDLLGDVEQCLDVRLTAGFQMTDALKDFFVDGLQSFHFVIDDVLFFLQMVFGFQKELAVPIPRVWEDGFDGVLKAE
jgi:hypothetical protein